MASGIFRPNKVLKSEETDKADQGRYPLGSWSGGTFIFHSPEAEERWREDVVDSGVHFMSWDKGRKLNDKTRQLVEFGFAPSADIYRGPDGDFYQMTPEAREDLQITAMRTASLKSESTKTDLGTALKEANKRIAPHATNWMAQQAPIAKSVPTATSKAVNDNQAGDRAANDNAPANQQAPGPLQFAQEFILTPPDEIFLPEEMTPFEELPEGSAGGDGAGRPFTRSQEKDPQPCIYCSKQTGKQRGPDQYQRDHVIPRSRGGNGSDENRVPSCRTCNQRKGPRTPKEWYKANGWIAQWLERLRKTTGFS